MENNLNVRVKPSTIPQAGFGVFTAKRSIKKGTNIIPYEGELKPLNGGDYTLQINRKQMLDAAKSRYLGGFINDCREFQRRKRLCSGVNARFARDRGRNIWVKATKNIPPNREIFASYGTEYWRKKKEYDRERKWKQVARPRKRKSMKERAFEMIIRKKKRNSQINNCGQPNSNGTE